jgi:hypothetical protein
MIVLVVVMILAALHPHLNSSAILYFLFLIFFRLHDSSLPLIDALDKSELALARKATFRKPPYLTTFQDYLERKKRLQPVIEDMASKMNITREGLSDRREQVFNIILFGC